MGRLKLVPLSVDLERFHCICIYNGWLQKDRKWSQNGCKCSHLSTMNIIATKSGCKEVFSRKPLLWSQASCRWVWVLLFKVVACSRKHCDCGFRNAKYIQETLSNRQPPQIDHSLKGSFKVDPMVGGFREVLLCSSYMGYIYIYIYM